MIQILEKLYFWSEYSPFYNTFYEDSIYLTLLYLSQASYIKIKAVDYSGGSFKVIFVKNLTK